MHNKPVRVLQFFSSFFSLSSVKTVPYSLRVVQRWEDLHSPLLKLLSSPIAHSLHCMACLAVGRSIGHTRRRTFNLASHHYSPFFARPSHAVLGRGLSSHQFEKIQKSASASFPGRALAAWTIREIDDSRDDSQMRFPPPRGGGGTPGGFPFCRIPSSFGRIFLRLQILLPSGDGGGARLCRTRIPLPKSLLQREISLVASFLKA